MATQAEVAAHLDMTQQAASKKLVELGISRGSKGYDLDAARIAYIRRLREQAAGRASGGKSLADERARLAHLQANAVEMKNMIAAGQLVEVAETERAWAAIVARCRAKMLAIAPRAAPQVVAMDDPNEAQAKLEELVHEALAELARGDLDEDGDAATLPGDAATGDPADDGAVRAAAEADGERVGGPLPIPQRRGQRRAR